MVLPDLRVLLLAGLEDPSPQRNCPFLELQQTFSMCQPGACRAVWWSWAVCLFLVGIPLKEDWRDASAAVVILVCAHVLD